MSTAKVITTPLILYRFGPYDLDTRRNELRKHGIRIRLERKPIQLLAALLGRAGEVVPRAELYRLLWGEEVFVDFEKNLTVAAAKLRAVLNDTVENPRYIETVAGEGYRFVAPVEQVFAPALPVALPYVERPAVSSSPVPNTENSRPGPEAVSNRFRIRKWLQKQEVPVALATLICIALISFAVAKLRSGKTLRTDANHPGKMMLVVLPFENLSGDPGEEYLSDGITEELSAQLGNLNPAQLAVIGRTSAMTYKHSPKTISQIGKELGVAYVLEGSVRREGVKVRITAQLIQVSDQTHLWSADYDRDMHSLLQVEDEIAQEITRQVGVSVAVNSSPNFHRHIPDPEAHKDYLLARYYWNKRTPAGRQSAEQHFRRAIQKDPQYAAAYAGLAECTPLPEAEAAALKAVELDPNSGEVWTARGWVELFRQVDVPAAERTLKTAIELDPNYATAHHWYAGVLEATGQLPEAIAELKEATTLDPLSLIIRSALAHMLSLADQQDAAMAELKLVFEIDPQFPKAHEVLGGIYERKGMYREAIHELQLSLEASAGKEELAAIGYIYAISGNKQAALDVLKRLLDMNNQSGYFALDIALVDAGLGRKEEAIQWMQTASLKPNDGWLSLRTDQRFDPIRSDPRFQDLLRRMKLSG
jgi:TolB-like protein/DNA-binding winged helix-turn-helix (wHTH) protein/tetratricopeptide (TPR) repeat protein